METVESNKAPYQFTFNLIFLHSRNSSKLSNLDSLGWSNNSLGREDDFTSIILLKLWQAALISFRAQRHIGTHAPSRCLLITTCHAEQLQRSEGNWQKCAMMCQPPPWGSNCPACSQTREKTWVFAVAADGPRRQASGFRWWVRKSSLHQECSSPAELSSILLPLQGYSIHHSYNVTVGDKTWAQHKLNPINSYAEEPVNKASPTKKEPNCLRTATISDTWGQSF